MRALPALAVLAILIASCSSPQQPPLPSGARAPSSTAGATAAAGTDQPALASATTAPYLRTELVDVRTQQRFTLASLVGKVVIVEGMAVW